MSLIDKNESIHSANNIHSVRLNSILKQSTDSLSHNYENYTESYEIIQHEMNKLKLSTPKTVEWEKVIKAGYKILTAGCEDLNIANYLVVALVAQYGSKILVTGTRFLDSYVTSKWETMRPAVSKSKLRARSVEWFYTNVFFIVENDVNDYDSDSAGQLYIVLTNYAENLSILSSQNYVVPSNLKKILQSVINAKKPSMILSNSSEKEFIKPSLISLEQEQLVTNCTEKLNSTPNIMKHNGAALLRECQKNLNKYISIPSGSPQYEPNTFYYRRISVWLNLQTLPKYNNDFVTQLQGPSEKEKARLIQEKKVMNQHGIIFESEKLLERYPFWLDANIISLKALKKLPENTDIVESIILYMLDLLLIRFPILKQCKFRNGDAMFSDSCSRYEHILRQSTKLHTVPESQSPATNKDNFQQLDEGFDESEFVKNLAMKERLFVGINNPRNYFKFHLELIFHCMKEKHYVLANAKISNLWQYVSDISFRSWEPDLAVSLSKVHIDTILALSEIGTELTGDDKLMCRNMYQYISGQNTYIASQIDTIRFFK